jgi:phosphoribosylformimino-5-aminoimidazole carboxamide ribonucleotide (ProFAR) isomerase
MKLRNKLKKIAVGVVIALSAFTIGGYVGNMASVAAKSNRMYVGEWATNYFDKAVINLHNQVIEVGVSKWQEYEDSNTLLIETTDGMRYYTTVYDCTLICTDINQ